MIDPISLFQKEFNESKTKMGAKATVCVLATAADNLPSVRFVLFKGLFQNKFTFATNYQSRKALEIEENENVSLAFYWEEFGRQIRIDGKAEKATKEYSDQVFANRPRASQLSAWSSDQSQPIKNRDELKSKKEQVEKDFEGKDVHRPDFWGCYLIAPTQIEFWQHDDTRLHHREVYKLENETWQKEILQP